MAKSPISITLDAENVTWLKGRARAVGARGVSELIDQLVTAARKQSPGGVVRSVVGTIDIDPSDPLLEGARAAVRDLFDASLGRPVLVKEPRAVLRPAKARPRRG
jgi:hypothetical protein